MGFFDRLFKGKEVFADRRNPDMVCEMTLCGESHILSEFDIAYEPDNSSKEYMEALHKLDAGGHVHNQNKVNDIIRTIQEEFPEVQLGGVLLGYVSICYLGKPYEVHTLDLTGGIIEHYKTGETLPDGLEKARTIAMRGGYEFIEVYKDCCRAVSASGYVSVIPG